MIVAVKIDPVPLTIKGNEVKKEQILGALFVIRDLGKSMESLLYSSLPKPIVVQRVPIEAPLRKEEQRTMARVYGPRVLLAVTPKAALNKEMRDRPSRDKEKGRDEDQDEDETSDFL